MGEKIDFSPDCLAPIRVRHVADHQEQAPTASEPTHHHRLSKQERRQTKPEMGQMSFVKKPKSLGEVVLLFRTVLRFG